MSIQKDLIIDVGMHHGNDTHFYLKKGFRVAAIEANPELVSKARIRFKEELSDGRLKIFELGIYEEEGIFDFYINETKDDWSSLIKGVGTRQDTKFHVVKVKCTTFDKILSEVGIPYYLKIDIEKADIYALQALKDFESKPKYISIEAHSLDYLCLLKSFGYSKFKVINQAKNHNVKCPNPPLEGVFVDQKFTGLSSGPFGEESPGPWMTMEEAAYEWLHRAMGHIDRSSVGAGWYDFHAKV